jgi:RNA polymerase sigma-70 factor (ECF subfamily)
MSGIADQFGVVHTEDAVVESFDGFYMREYRQIYALALALTRDRAEAEDATQEAFTAAYRSWDRITNPSGWIRVTVTRRIMSLWRRMSVARRAAPRLGSELAEIPDDTIDFWNEVTRLPLRQAQAIALYYLEDRPTDEIAALLGCEPSTVRIHLSKGRKTLAARLEVTP